MKKSNYKFLKALPFFLTLNTLLFTSLCFSQSGAAINTTGSAADASAILDVSSTNAGMLIPRMTIAQRNAIQGPAEGLQIFNSDNKCLEIFVDGSWQTVSCPFKCGASTVTFTYRGASVVYGTVKGGYNSGQYCWLDRNLGATAVATAVVHDAGYGDMFQWGRLDDGHQARNPLSNSTTIQSSSTIPGHSNFIKSSSNWYSGSNPDNLWQGVSGINNVCPSGWRIPTETEIDNERSTWAVNGGNNYNGAIASPLKLSATGGRGYSAGAVNDVGTHGVYWTSTISGTNARALFFFNSDALMGSFNRADGRSVRCIKD